MLMLTVALAARGFVTSGSASLNVMEEGLGIPRVTIWAEAEPIPQDRKKAIEKMKMRMNFFIAGTQKDPQKYTFFFIKSQQKRIDHPFQDDLSFSTFIPNTLGSS